MFDLQQAFKIEQPLLEAKPGKYTALIHSAIIAAVVLAVGTWIISTTVLISKDGVTYITYARDMIDRGLPRGNFLTPGYPLLICLIHKIAAFLLRHDSLKVWIVSAQAASLVCTTIGSMAIYFIGCRVTGARRSLIGVLILSILPVSALYGSDALSDWPAVTLLALGLVMLLKGAEKSSPAMFALAGLFAGLGYLVRAEVVQLLLYGSVWLGWNLLRPVDGTRRWKAALNFVLLWCVFLLITVPFVLRQDYVFPKQEMWKVPQFLHHIFAGPVASGVMTAYSKFDQPLDHGKAITTVCETLLYYFMPAWVIGGCWYVQNKEKNDRVKFFLAAFIIFNVMMIGCQASLRNFLSRRHTLGLVAMTICFAPVGMEIIAGWLSGIRQLKLDRHRWFVILMAAGVCICAAKFARMAPLGKREAGYLAAAQWIAQNTRPQDAITLRDSRVAFYAGRRGWLEYTDTIPEGAAYIVQTEDAGKPPVKGNYVPVFSAPVQGKDKNAKVVVSRIVKATVPGEKSSPAQ